MNSASSDQTVSISIGSIYGNGSGKWLILGEKMTRIAITPAKRAKYLEMLSDGIEIYLWRYLDDGRVIKLKVVK